MNLLITLLVFVFFLLGAAAPAHAYRLQSDREDYAQCVATAAKTFGIPELPIWVILDVEGGTVGRVSQNTNNTYDIGPMQINSIWLKHLAPFGISENDIKHNLCMNIYVGTWIYAKELQRHKTLAKAFAYYHSPTPKHQHRYLGLVQNAIDRRLQKFQKEQALASEPQVKSNQS